MAATKRVTVGDQTMSVPADFTQDEILEAVAAAHPEYANGTLRDNGNGTFTVEARSGSKG